MDWAVVSHGAETAAIFLLFSVCNDSVNPCFSALNGAENAKSWLIPRLRRGITSWLNSDPCLEE